MAAASKMKVSSIWTRLFPSYSSWSFWLEFPDGRCHDRGDHIRSPLLPASQWICTSLCANRKAGKSTHFLWGSSLLHSPAHLFSTLLAVLWPHHTHCLTNFQGYFQVHCRWASPKGFILLPLSRKTADCLVQVTLIWQSDGGNYPNTAFRFHKQSLSQPPWWPSRTHLPEVSAAPGIRHNNQRGFIKAPHEKQVGSGDVASCS